MPASEYSYPTIYVEVKKAPLKGLECILELESLDYIKTTCNRRDVTFRRAFSKRIYERVHVEVLDLERGEVKKSYIVKSPRNGTYILVEAGVKVSLVEVAGRQVHLYCEEGDEVVEGERIASVITGKYEVRNVRSPDDGIVVLIGEFIETPERSVIAIAGDEDVRRITVRED